LIDRKTEINETKRREHKKRIIISEGNGSLIDIVKTKQEEKGDRDRWR
jgi:hypothetical protein